MVNLRHIRFEGRPGRASAPRVVSLASPTAVRRTPGDDPPPPDSLPAFVLDACGLEPSAYRRRPLERRRHACLRAVRAGSDDAARLRLGADLDLRRTALGALLIGVSSFFRDEAVFDALAARVLPALRDRERPIRVWSAGCSTGAELYSVAILLAEAGLLHRARLLGTDCRADAIVAAREAVFGDEALAAVSAARRERFFERTRNGWRVARALRQAAGWQVADALRETPPGPWDLVLCRNLLIYLRPRAADTMLHRMTVATSDGGFLVLGRAERPPAALRLAPAARCVYRHARL